MTNREKIISALERKPGVGRVPHFELQFFLTMEVLGKVHIRHRNYGQWIEMSEKERILHRNDMADILIAIAKRYEHSAINVRPNPETLEEALRFIELIREKCGNEYFLFMPGDATYAIPDGSLMEKFIYRLVDEPEKVKEEADRMVSEALKKAEVIKKQGYLDGFVLNSDYCFNSGPFLSPALFSEFITPYLARLIQGYREMGFYTIKHTDGNIMPILDQLIQAKPHALHSLDPQAGVDIAEVKRLVGDKVCLIGNVNCGLMQTGTDEEVAESVRYALKNGMPGGGYIFSTSNCVFTGMPLKRYELMVNIWKAEGNY